MITTCNKNENFNLYLDSFIPRYALIFQFLMMKGLNIWLGMALANSASCDSVKWREIGGRFYHFSENSGNYYEAFLQCRNLDSYVVNITSLLEYLDIEFDLGKKYFFIAACTAFHCIFRKSRFSIDLGKP